MIFQKAYDKHFSRYENLDDEDYDIIAEDIIKNSMRLVAKAHDDLSVAFSDEKELIEYKRSFDKARETMKEVSEMALAICNNYKKEIDLKAYELAFNLGIGDSTYYNGETLLDRILQLTKFTNNNTLHSLVLRTISGDRYNVDMPIIREHLFNLYLNYSRIFESFNNDSLQLEQNLLELLIFITSLNILFNIEITELCQ